MMLRIAVGAVGAPRGRTTARRDGRRDRLGRRRWLRACDTYRHAPASRAAGGVPSSRDACERTPRIARVHAMGATGGERAAVTKPRDSAPCRRAVPAHGRTGKRRADSWRACDAWRCGGDRQGPQAARHRSSCEGVSAASSLRKATDSLAGIRGSHPVGRSTRDPDRVLGSQPGEGDSRGLAGPTGNANEQRPRAGTSNQSCPPYRRETRRV